MEYEEIEACHSYVWPLKHPQWSSLFLGPWCCNHMMERRELISAELYGEAVRERMPQRTSQPTANSWAKTFLKLESGCFPLMVVSIAYTSIELEGGMQNAPCISLLTGTAGEHRDKDHGGFCWFVSCLPLPWLIRQSAASASQPPILSMMDHHARVGQLLFSLAKRTDPDLDPAQ